MGAALVKIVIEKGCNLVEMQLRVTCLLWLLLIVNILPNFQINTNNSDREVRELFASQTTILRL